MFFTYHNKIFYYNFFHLNAKSYNKYKMASQKSIEQEINELLSGLSEKEINELSEEKVMELRKKLNPYGQVIKGDKKFINVSVTQIEHDYWKKLIISAFVGFLNRMNDEWNVPSGVPVTPVYEYLEDPSKVDTPQNILDGNCQRTIDDYEYNKEMMKERVVVKKFIETLFKFNPEEHVRSSYRPHRADSTRNPIETEQGKLAVDHLKRTDPEFAADEELYGNTNDFTVKKVTKTIKGKNGMPDKVIEKNVKVYNNVVDYGDSSSKSVATGSGKDPQIRQAVREFLPPHDMFGRFNMYLENNYEELRDFVKDAYCEKPDYELAINVHSTHDTEDEATKFIKKHRDEILTSLYTVQSGKWCFIDSFQAQRENVSFYNKNTHILEEMHKQRVKDQELGRDLMTKRVEKEKKKNNILDGKDADTFKKFISQNKTLSKMGAEYIGDKADDDIPEDAVQVDVWKIAKGGIEITKDKFYSSADASTVTPHDNQ